MGERLFNAAREDLATNGYFSTVVWGLSDNERALRFFKKMGVSAEQLLPGVFDNDTRARVAFGFAAS